MKINILAPNLKISGGVMVLVRYADYLLSFGHDVRIYTPDKSKLRCVFANLLKYHSSDWIKVIKSRIIRIPKIDEKYFLSADVMLFSAHEHAVRLKNFGIKIGKKVYLVQHDERLYHDKDRTAAESYRLPYEYIAVSTWLKEMLEKDFYQSAELLLNTVDKDIFYPHYIARQDRDIRILLMHHTYKWKGTEDGLKLVEEMKEKYPNIKLVMYGARQENIRCDEYHFKPFGAEVAKIFSGCDIFLCPSWDEGFGLPSLEAMACGCTVVTYDNGGSRDFAFDGKNALVAERKNFQVLKSKLEKMINDRDLRMRISKNGIEYVKKMPSWKEQTKKLEELIK